MPRLAQIARDVLPDALVSHGRRLESLEIRRPRPPAHAIARRTTTQSVANNTIVAISFDTQEADTDAMFAPTSALITVVTPGLYLCVGQISWALAATANTRLLTALRLNGATTLAVDERVGSTTEGEGQNVSAVLALVAGNTIELIVYQTNAAAAARTVATATYWPRLSVTRLGPAS